MPLPARRASFAFALLLIAYTAHAVEFDENVRAPMVGNAAELRSRLESRNATFAATDAPSALARVRSAAAARQHFDATWLLGRMVDSGQALPELEALGFVRREDGGYSVDTLAHPEWRSLADTLWQVVNPQMIDKITPALLARGFTTGDMNLVRDYIASQELDQARSRFKLDLAISTSRYARKLQRLKRPVDRHFMWNYFYQRSAGIAEVERKWSQGLLDALEPRAQRILASYLAEGAGSWLILPTVDDEAMAYERDLMLKPDFEQQARKAFEEGRL
jgi:hypothetical protein